MRPAWYRWTDRVWQDAMARKRSTSRTVYSNRPSRARRRCSTARKIMPLLQTCASGPRKLEAMGQVLVRGQQVGRTAVGNSLLDGQERWGRMIHVCFLREYSKLDSLGLGKTSALEKLSLLSGEVSSAFSRLPCVSRFQTSRKCQTDPRGRSYPACPPGSDGGQPWDAA